jgi:predicted metal-dependent peptidase
MGLGWKYPFFFPVLARIEYRVSVDIPTACVDLKGLIRVNPFYLAQLSDAEVQGVIAHECMHLILLHQDRRANRGPWRWNKATDRIINLTLKTMGIALPSGVLYADDDQKDWTAEQLYDAEEECDEQNYCPWQVPVGAGCGPSTDGNGPGQDDKKDGQGQGDDPGDEDGQGTPSDDTLRRQWREIAAQCKVQAKQAGSTAGDMLAKLLEVPPPRVRWAQVLRGSLYRALAEAGRDDVSWSRRSRRSTTTIILPGGVTYKCRAAVVIDTRTITRSRKRSGLSPVHERPLSVKSASA